MQQRTANYNSLFCQILDPCCPSIGALVQSLKQARGYVRQNDAQTKLKAKKRICRLKVEEIIFWWRLLHFQAKFIYKDVITYYYEKNDVSRLEKRFSM